MVLNGFNQEGGKVTGNIGKVEVISRQNTSTTTGSSSGISLGISANGVPSSVNINGSRTNGDRAFVDNQSTFVVGEGSNLHVGTVENTGAVIGKEGNSTFKIDTYAGKDIQNYDTMTTTGGSIGASLGGKPGITNVGFNQDSRDKQGITRNTVVGDVEITKAEGSPINRDLGKANEITKDTHRSTNINVESQTIEYATNPGKLKEDIGKAKKEISDVTTAIKESINDRGDDNRNFFGQLREVRLSETVNNIAGKRLNEAQKSEDVVSAWKDAYKDLGYNLDVKYTTGEDTPEMKDKAGTAYVSKDGVHTIIININAKENSTKAGLIGTLAEEASHIVNGVAGRQIATGTEEKGLESTGRAANAYFKEEYKGSNQNMTYTSDGKIDTSKLGTHVGDTTYSAGISFGGSASKILSIGGNVTVGVVLDDKGGITGFKSLSGSFGFGVGGGIDILVPVSSMNPNAKTIKDFAGFGQSFSVNAGFSGLSVGLTAGFDGTISGSFKLGPKNLKDFNNVKKMGATITYNPGYTWLIPLEKVRDYLSKIPRGLETFNTLKKEVFKLKSKRKK